MEGYLRSHYNTTTWTSLCEPGWSNVGLFHYPPTDPSKCYINIMAIDIIYVLGAIASLPPIVLGIQSMLQMYHNRGNRGLWVCMIASTIYNLNSFGVILARILLTHEQEILGLPTMLPYLGFYMNASASFWTASFVFMYKYLDYIRSSCKLGVLVRSKQRFNLAAFGYTVGACTALGMPCIWIYVGFGSIEEIGIRSLYAAAFMDITVIIAALIVWPLVSITIAYDLHILLNEAKSHNKADNAARAQVALRKLKVITVLLLFSGAQSMWSIASAVLQPSFARTLPYVITGRILLLCPVLTTAGVLILIPNARLFRGRNSCCLGQPFARSRNRIAPTQHATTPNHASLLDNNDER